MSASNRISTEHRKRSIQILLTALVAIALLAVTLAALRPPAPHSTLAAIVNNDEPIELEGQIVPMGRQLAAEFALLDGPFAWEITTQDRAEDGLRSGHYQAAVFIPANFSASVTSLSSLSEAVQATVEAQVRPGASAAESTQVELEVWKATANLGSMLTTEFVAEMFSGLAEMGDQLQLAADGASEMADGAEQAQSGTAALADGNRELGAGASLAAEGIGLLADGAWQLSDGAGDAADGIGQLADGGWALADGAGDAATGLGQLATGTDDLTDGLDQLAAGARAAADGTEQLSEGLGILSDNSEALVAGAQEAADGAAEVNDALTKVDPADPPKDPGLVQGAEVLAGGAESLAVGVDQLVDGLTQYAGDIEEILGPLSTGVTELNKFVQELAPYLEDAETNKEAAKEFLENLQAMLDQFCADEPTNPLCQEESALKEFWDNIEEVYDVIDQAADGLKDLPSEMEAAAEQFATFQSQIEQMFDPDSDESLPALSAGANELAGGMRNYADGMSLFAGGFGEFSDGMGDLADGITQYTDGVDQSADGAQAAAGGIEQLADGLEAAAEGAGDLSEGAWQAADGVGQLAGGAEQIAEGADQASAGVGLLSEGAGELADGAGQAGDGVGQLADGADQLAGGADQLGEGLGLIEGGLTELSDGLGQAGEAIPAVDKDQAEALGQSLASPVERPALVIGTQAGPAIGLALLLWLASLLLQSVYPPAVTHLSSSTRSSGSLTLEALWRPAAWSSSIGAVGGLILALVGKPGAAGMLGLILFGALIGAIFAAVQQALALVFGRGWITASVIALVLGVSAALASATASLLSAIANLLPTGQASNVFTFLLVPGSRNGVTGILVLILWGALALIISSAATAGKRKTPEKAEAAAAA